jgi:hypothetical protein
MPRGPKGEKRPADVIGATVIRAEIAASLSRLRAQAPVFLRDNLFPDL